MTRPLEFNPGLPLNISDLDLACVYGDSVFGPRRSCATWTKFDNLFSIRGAPARIRLQYCHRYRREKDRVE